MSIQQNHSFQRQKQHKKKFSFEFSVSFSHFILTRDHSHFYSLSVTGFGEILPLWQKGKNLLRRRYLLQNCEPTVAKISCLLPNFPCSKSPNIEKLSSHLVTLLSLSLSLSLYHSFTLLLSFQQIKKERKYLMKSNRWLKSFPRSKPLSHSASK